MKIIASVLATVILIAAVALVFIYSGAFNVAANEPDSAPMAWLMETVRERSIETRSADIEVPPLDDPELIATGAEHYAEMCAVCHLAPGIADTELRAGLNPEPPELAEHGAHDPAETFWIVKNGIKMTGMPAWGDTHDDASIWGLVAFVEKLPDMPAEEYRRLTEDAAGGHGHESSGEGHGHDAAGSDGQAPAREPHSHEHGGGSKEPDHDSAAAAVSNESKSEPVQAVDDFFDALARKRTDQAEALLAPDVLIFESGGVERSRAEYASHHLQSDAAFLANAEHRVVSRAEGNAGELAWVATAARITNTAGKEAIDIDSTETMVLRRTPRGWRIAHIHWSSRPVESE
ncbi:hypothetical protein BH24PSE2_BH24PSE2_07950 [soil metagenome]